MDTKQMRIMNLPTLRRSNRLIAKTKAISKETYVKHIEMLHLVAQDLLPMALDLDIETLRKIIDSYENIIGGLLTDNLLNLQTI
jgi:hypothetical protein